MIYVIPFPLVDNEEINLKEKTKGFVEINAPHFWYLHGALQDKFKYDGAYMFVDYGTSKTDNVQVINNKLYLSPGIYDVVVEGCDKPCRAYLWHQEGKDADGNNYVHLRGVVIMISTNKTGLDDLAYATNLYTTKPFTF